MARSLSALQRNILRYAHQKGVRTFEGSADYVSGKHSGHIILSEEALDAFYGAKNNKTRVSVSRSFRRLEDRGLALYIQKGLLNKDYRSGIMLTDDGIKQANG